MYSLTANYKGSSLTKIKVFKPEGENIDSKSSFIFM